MSPPDPDSTVRATAILVAAGGSTRMGPGVARKPWLELEGRSVLERSAAAFAACPAVSALVIVAHPEDLERARVLGAGDVLFGKPLTVVLGGARRADSVRAGLGAADGDARLVAIHDAARPLVSLELIARALASAAEHGAALVAMRASDSIHFSADGHRATRALERAELWCAQTPQVFERQRFAELLERALREGWSPTDDAALWERYVGPVALVEGERANLKLTTPEDVIVAAALLRARAAAAGGERRR